MPRHGVGFKSGDKEDGLTIVAACQPSECLRQFLPRNLWGRNGHPGTGLLPCSAGKKAPNSGRPISPSEAALIPNPILKVLSSMATHQVQCLLMGGQACVFYGAAEFSRDSDFAILAEPANLARLKEALAELQAPVIAVPPFKTAYLERGHAIHFRCQHPECAGLRVDVMSKMRGVDSFDQLWDRRTTLELADGSECNLLAVPDLVKAKKTQCDKDWPMIRRLMEAHHFEFREDVTPERLDFWLLELRTADLLIELANNQPEPVRRGVSQRPLLQQAIHGQVEPLERALLEEELTERAADRQYWLPLKRELEALRRTRIS